MDQNDSSRFSAETTLAGLCVKQKPATNQQAVPHVWAKALMAVNASAKVSAKAFLPQLVRETKTFVNAQLLSSVLLAVFTGDMQTCL